MLFDLLQNRSFTPTMLVIAGIVMVFALIFHNVFQSWVAARYGDYGPKFAGFTSWDPQQHLQPIGVVFLFLLGFGWTNPVAVNGRNYRGRGRQEAVVWYAGPVAFLIVAFISFLVARLVAALGSGPELVGAFAYAGNIAIIHAVVNVFPVYPLDGARAALAWGNADVKRVIQQIASYGFIGFIVVFLVLQYTGILGLVSGLFRRLVYGLLGLVPGL